MIKYFSGCSSIFSQSRKPDSYTYIRLGKPQCRRTRVQAPPPMSRCPFPRLLVRDRPTVEPGGTALPVRGASPAKSSAVGTSLCARAAKKLARIASGHLKTRAIYDFDTPMLVSDGWRLLSSGGPVLPRLTCRAILSQTKHLPANRLAQWPIQTRARL
jgi:hypothetical protein